MSELLGDRAQDHLTRHHVMTIAITAEDGPWAAAVFYASDGMTLYFLSSPDTRHCRNLARDTRVAATIQGDCSDWTAVKGIQLEGTVSLLSGEEERVARALYAKKFPIVGLAAQVPAAIVKALAKVRWYRLTPQTLYFIDNSAGFGRRDQTVL